jgi:hypothetical protein
VVGCESLFVPYGHAASAGPGALAGWLFASTATGMMAGDLGLGRIVGPGWRDRLIEPLRLLLAVPDLLFFLNPPPAVAVPPGFVAAVGYAASLPLQDRLLANTDDAIQGQVMGLQMNGMMLGQAIGALIAGAVASFPRPGPWARWRRPRRPSRSCWSRACAGPLPPRRWPRPSHPRRTSHDNRVAQFS